MSKYGVTSGSYFPVFSPGTGIYRPEITPYLDTFHASLFFIIHKSVNWFAMQVEIVYKVCDFKAFNWFVFRTKIDLYIIPIKILNQKMCLLKILLKAHSEDWDNFLATENPLKMMTKAFYFTVKAIFVLKIFKFLSCLFGRL